MKKIIVLCMAVLAVSLVSCSSTRTVTRVAADTQIDLSGRWNATDAQLVAEEMIDDVLRRPWLPNFTSAEGRNPVVIVGEVQNRSHEHIETLMFTRSLERELINSGRVRFVASESARENVRQERMDQQFNASPETMRRLGQETGADFFLGGVITSVTDREGGLRVVFYKVNLELIHMETNEIVWLGDKEIKKIIEQPRRRA